MTTQVVDIGARVRSNDGKDLGSVDQLIIHGPTGRVGGFLLDTGIVSASKIVDAGLVARADADGVVLSIDAGDADGLPTLVQEQIVKAPDGLTVAMRGGGMVDIGGAGDQWFLRGSGGGELPQTGAPAFFRPAVIGNVVAQNVSNLPEGSLLISEGTDVVGSDGKKVGRVDQVFVDADRRVTGVLVQAGWLFKRDVRLPVSLVDGATSEQVRLNVTAEEAERYAQSDEG